MYLHVYTAIVFTLKDWGGGHMCLNNTYIGQCLEPLWDPDIAINSSKNPFMVSEWYISANPKNNIKIYYHTIRKSVLIKKQVQL